MALGYSIPILILSAEIGFIYWFYQRAMKAESIEVFSDPFAVPLTLNAIYLSIIFIGKKLMEKREPFDVVKWMLVYNMYQAVFNIVCVAGILYEVHSTGMKYWANGIDRSPNGLRLGFFIYLHYHNKYLEFSDSFFMILRKKFDQLSFLHVYHHTLLSWSWWVVCIWAPGGDAWFGSCVNSFIHVLMYSYYLCASFGITCPWKKMLTQLQMVQFCVCMSQSIYLYFFTSEDVYPKGLILLQAFVMLNMLVLFGNFYRKTYKKKSQSTKSKTQERSLKEGVDTSKTKKAEPLITFEIWKPMAAITLYVGFLYILHQNMMKADSTSVFGDHIAIPAVMNVIYLLTIFIGKRLMKSRAPYELRQWMLAYNFYQAVFNLYCVIGLIQQVHSLGMSYWGSGVDRSPRGLQLGFFIYLHYQNKYVEFLDTLFMVLRKKFEQISFLHIYHHTLLSWCWWIVASWAPGGDAWFGSCVNSFIHVLMYSYYLCATFKIRCPWKKVLTQLQMVQFCICMSQSIYIYFFCDESIYPKNLVLLQAWVMINMLVLFANFYRKSYSKESKGKSNQDTKVRVNRPKNPTSEYYESLASQVVNGEKYFTSKEVSVHNHRSDAWISCHGSVFDITSFISKHPGGDIIMLSAGTDATILVESYHPNGSPEQVMQKYCIGKLQDYNTYYRWSSEFYPELKRRVCEHLKNKGLPRRGRLGFKAILILTGFVLSYSAMLYTASCWAGLAFGIFAAQVGLSIQHDGNHGAFSKKGWLNKLAGWGMDLIGASSAVWEYQHVVGHHQYTNLVTDLQHKEAQNDPDVFSSYPLLRMHPTDAWEPKHRWQHIYAVPIFSLMTLSKVFLSDLKWFFACRCQQIDMTGRFGSLGGMLYFMTVKIATMSLFIALPCYLNGVVNGILPFVVAHLVCGEYLAIFFIVNHISESCLFLTASQLTVPLPDTKSPKQKKPTPPSNDWATTQVACCVNWCSGSSIANHVSGGLNHQIEHHLFPSISHMNYPTIAHVVQEVCEEFGVPYKSHPTFMAAFWDMIGHLKTMGVKPKDHNNVPTKPNTIASEVCPVISDPANAVDCNAVFEALKDKDGKAGKDDSICPAAPSSPSGC